MNCYRSFYCALLSAASVVAGMGNIATAAPQAPAKAVWVADATKASPVARPAAGQVNGAPFVVKKAVFRKTMELPFSDAPVDVFTLELQGNSSKFPDGKLLINVAMKHNAKLEGKRLLHHANDPLQGPEGATEAKPLIQSMEMTWRGSGGTASVAGTVQLQFGKRTGSMQSGNIYLVLDDGMKSFVAGTFEAIVK